ncbi:MAG TPA: hypothetical protein VM935_13505, partial [Chitinophagaceae bacterium]|nr:hypothetical protein [Chitinophagaceae bacterium]
LDEATKEEMINDLKARWNEETNGNAIFISALEKTNISDLRDTILEKVKDLYKVRFPYKSEFFY